MLNTRIKAEKDRLESEAYERETRERERMKRERAERLEAGEPEEKEEKIRYERLKSERSEYYVSSKNASHTPQTEVFVENTYEEDEWLENECEQPEERRHDRHVEKKYSDPEEESEDFEFDFDDQDSFDGNGKKKKKKKHHVIRNILLIMIALCLVLFAFVYYYVGKINYAPLKDKGYTIPGFSDEDSGKDLSDFDLEEYEDENVRNILLIGTDARAEGSEDSRSDSMIILSICPKQKKLYLTSILRDSYVTIPNVGMNRINMAYQLGGAELLIETIEQNFHVPIDNYVKVDFWSFADLVDALGGVDITVTAEEVHYVDAYLSEINRLMGIYAEDSFIYEEGLHHFNGRQALAYARIRYIGTDFARTERQRTVLSACVDRIRTNPISFISGAGTMLESMTTDISSMDLTLLTFKGVSYIGYDIENFRIPADGTWWNDTMGPGGEVLGLDVDANANMLRNLLYGE